MKDVDKWKFAIGTTSRVPDSGGLHYLIADFDDRYLPAGIFKNGNNFIVQRTEHGWHVYTDCITTFEGVINLLKQIGADPVWIKIAEERGYLFLADKYKLEFPWPVEHMVLYRG
jgi:hypothetical protein